MAKRLGSPYLPGRRSQSWRKIKNRPQQEVVIGGFTSGTGNRTGTFGALLVGYYEGDAAALRRRCGQRVRPAWPGAADPAAARAARSTSARSTRRRPGPTPGTRHG